MSVTYNLSDANIIMHVKCVIVSEMQLLARHMIDAGLLSPVQTVREFRKIQAKRIKVHSFDLRAETNQVWYELECWARQFEQQLYPRTKLYLGLISFIAIIATMLDYVSPKQSFAMIFVVLLGHFVKKSCFSAPELSDRDLVKAVKEARKHIEVRTDEIFDKKTNQTLPVIICLPDSDVRLTSHVYNLGSQTENLRRYFPFDRKEKPELQAKAAEHTTEDGVQAEEVISASWFGGLLSANMKEYIFPVGKAENQYVFIAIHALQKQVNAIKGIDDQLIEHVEKTAMKLARDERDNGIKQIKGVKFPRTIRMGDHLLKVELSFEFRPSGTTTRCLGFEVPKKYRDGRATLYVFCEASPHLDKKVLKSKQPHREITLSLDEYTTDTSELENLICTPNLLRRGEMFY